MYNELCKLDTPCYVVDEAKLIENLTILQSVAKQAGCKILLAQKAFSMFSLYPLIGTYLAGTTASGLYEARLGHEKMGQENHVFCTAYSDREIDEVLSICDHVVFNSFSQWEKYRTKARASGKSFGIRVNPECSTQGHDIYDPCAPGSRLGVTAENFRPDLLDGIEGLHFHTLCEQNSDALIKTLEAVEEKFGDYLPRMNWVNFGGGHHITRADYDREALVTCIRSFREKYKLDVYLEPGEAVALNAGYLVGTVLDIVHNGLDIAILDVSAACHMPDVLEMPYRAPVYFGDEPNKKAHTYRLTGATCLAGDIIGDYSFDHQLAVGCKVIFCDMAIYSMVKNNTFNGMPLPSILLRHKNGEICTVKAFDYNDFSSRLS